MVRPSAHGPKGDDVAAWYAEQAKQVVAQGYRCLKVYPFSGEQVITPERIARGIAIVRAMREARKRGEISQAELEARLAAFREVAAL
jgi:L-alanine-DL-glutamate epimerase-like enolase superfamily enzyme